MKENGIETEKYNKNSYIARFYNSIIIMGAIYRPEIQGWRWKSFFFHAFFLLFH